jgi:hypothetical protein
MPVTWNVQEAWFIGGSFSRRSREKELASTRSRRGDDSRANAVDSARSFLVSPASPHGKPTIAPVMQLPSRSPSRVVRGPRLAMTRGRDRKISDRDRQGAAGRARGG